MCSVAVTENANAPEMLNSSSFINTLNFVENCKEMERGHKVQKLKSKNKWENGDKLLSYDPKTQELLLSTRKKNQVLYAKEILDLSLIKEIGIFNYNATEPGRKWQAIKFFQECSNSNNLVLLFGNQFVPKQWVLKFESDEICYLWFNGIVNLMKKHGQASDHLKMEAWLWKQFYLLSCKKGITLKQMKLFVSLLLQKEVRASEFQRITQEKMENFDGFKFAIYQLLNYDALYHKVFSRVIRQYCSKISLIELTRFFSNVQKDNHVTNEKIGELINNFLNNAIAGTNLQHMTCEEFIDFLFSSENSVFDPINKTVTDDMTQPLTNYWIASSFHTFLTGNQYTSKSSLDAYSNVLLTGCRCIDIACWDGGKKVNDDPNDVVIYHGFTSKLDLRDVLCTIRDYE